MKIMEDKSFTINDLSNYDNTIFIGMVQLVQQF